MIRDSEIGFSSRTASISSSENMVAASIISSRFLRASASNSAGISSIRTLFAVVSFEVDCLHGQQIDHSLEIRFQTDRDLQGDGVVAQFGAKLSDHPGGIGAAPVAFVDEGDAGDLDSASSGDRR